MSSPAGSMSRKWYVCGLKEVKKAVKLGIATSIVVAANIEQSELANGNVDEQVAEIMEQSEEKVGTSVMEVCNMYCTCKGMCIHVCAI